MASQTKKEQSRPPLDIPLISPLPPLDIPLISAELPLLSPPVDVPLLSDLPLLSRPTPPASPLVRFFRNPFIKPTKDSRHPSPSSTSARDVDFTHGKTGAVEDNSVFKIVQTVEMKPAAASASRWSDESVPPNKKLPTPISLLIPPQKQILLPPSSTQSYPLSLDPQNHQFEIADITPSVVIDQQPCLVSPQCSVTVLVASDAKCHLQSNLHALERLLTDFGVQRDLWMAQVGFDEELLCGGSGYVQEVLITILEDLNIEGDYSVIQQIGKILSPFPGVVRMPQCFFRTPVFKHDGTVWETYNDFVRDHVNTLDSFEYDSMRRLYMATSQEVEEPAADQEKGSSKEKESSKTEGNSTATTSNSSSAHTTGGRNRSKKAKGKTPEDPEQENSSDDSDDSHDQDPHAGTSPRHRPRIQFEIITEIMGQSLRETLKIAGAFTFQVQPKSDKNPCSTSNVEFLSVDLQGPDTGIQRHYDLQYVMICVDSHDPSSYSTVQQPLDTPLFADKIKEGKNNKGIAQSSKSAGLQASVKNLFGFNCSYSHNNGTEVATTSERTRFRKQIRKWNEENIVKLTYFGSNKESLGSLNLPPDSSELPIVDYHHPGQKNEGTPPEEMTVKLSSLWVTRAKNEGAEVGNPETSKFSIFSRKKVEPVPIYTNIVPCVVIDFQTTLLDWTFVRRKLSLAVGADTAQIEQAGEEGAGEECIHVIPSTYRSLTEQRPLESFET